MAEGSGLPAGITFNREAVADAAAFAANLAFAHLGPDEGGALSAGRARGPRLLSTGPDRTMTGDSLEEATVKALEFPDSL